MSFVGLFTGLSGVRAGQVGIDTASNNVANANSAGYTRQRVSLSATPAYQSPVGPLGTGVRVDGIERLRDRFLDDRARGAAAGAADTGVRASVLRTLEDLTGEPDAGLSVRLGALWANLETWANDPADVASRRQVLTELAAVAGTTSSISGQWDALGADLQVQRDVQIAATNDALAQLHALDDRLANADPNRVGTELYDQRDLLLDRIAELTGATARVGADGRSEVTLGGTALVAPAGPSLLSVDGTGTVVATDPGGTVTSTAGVLGGELGGLTRAIDVDLPVQRAALDAWVVSFADAVNAANAAGVTATGAPGGPLLTYDPADPSGTLAPTTADPAALAAAVTGAPPAPNDGTNARAFADLRLTPVPGGGGGPRTLDAHLADVLTGLAGDVRAARSAADAAGSVSRQAGSARSAQHGVSLDEEMVDLVRYQRALEAASRVMTTVDQALDVLVNRTGIVGR